jgi:hypothetical protein
MRGQRSIPVRIARLSRQTQAPLSAREIAWLAAEYGLHPEEVRREAARHQDHIRRYGRKPVEGLAVRLAEEYGVPAAELMAEAERVVQRREKRGW